jgi:hypothetical protein
MIIPRRLGAEAAATSVTFQFTVLCLPPGSERRTTSKLLTWAASFTKSEA